MTRLLADTIAADQERLRLVENCYNKTEILLRAFTRAVNNATGKETLVLSTSLRPDYLLLHNYQDTRPARWTTDRQEVASYAIQLNAQKPNMLQRLFSNAAGKKVELAILFKYLDSPRCPGELSAWSPIGDSASFKEKSALKFPALNRLLQDIYKSLPHNARLELDLPTFLKESAQPDIKAEPAIWPTAQAAKTPPPPPRRRNILS